MAKTVAITGAGGFVGSALAASFLVEDPAVRILSLAHDDPDGSRVRQAVGRALRGFGGNADAAGLIEPVAVDLRHADALQALAAVQADELWHVAAHMSYDLSQLTPAFDFNAVASTRLLRACPGVGRFYFVSTTGVVGPGDAGTAGRVVPEDLLDEFEALNPYTVSKAMAEYMLWRASATCGTPLTILRLGSVIGHSRTGWVNDTRYGYYSYLQAFKRFMRSEPVFYVDIDPGRCFPVIHVDHLGLLCGRLRGRTAAPAQEVFHVCNGGLKTVAEHFRLVEHATGNRMSVAYGPGEKSFNQVFNKINADNNRFMGTRHRFAMERLADAVGEIPSLTEDGLRTVINAYFAS